MAEVKAEFPIGKTQWGKWNDDQRKAFNVLRERGVDYNTAVKYISSDDFGAEEPQLKKHKNIFDIIEDVAEAVEDVAEVAAQVSPVIAVAKTVVKATKKKGK